jgi:hypothetical protein
VKRLTRTRWLHCSTLVSFFYKFMPIVWVIFSITFFLNGTEAWDGFLTIRTYPECAVI